MLRIALSLAAVFALMGTMQASASCTQAAVLGAPNIPSVAESDYAGVETLRSEVSDYIDRAEARLERCGGPGANPDYGLALTRLENVADRFNRLAAYYNRSLAVAAN